MRTKKSKTDGQHEKRQTPLSKVRKVYWKWSENGKPDPVILARIVESIVHAARPEKIVLFGSAARGEMGPDSDYDLLVVKGGKFNHWRMLTKIRRELPGLAPVDIVLATPEDVERYRDSYCLVYYPALREGKVVYDAHSIPAKRPARMAQSRPQQPGRRAGH